MRSPYWRLICFFLLLVVPAVIGEFYVRSLPNPAKSKHAFLQEHSTEIETLVLGSSHTYYGINPFLLGEHAFSAAMSSQTLRYDDYILHAYPFPQLKTIILPISDFSFYEELEATTSWFVASRYRLYMSCNIHPRLSVYDWEITAFPSYIEKLKTLWQPLRMKWSNVGQGLEYTLNNRPHVWDNGKERASSNSYTDFSSAIMIQPYLEHIAQTADKNDIQLLLLTTPLSKTYRKYQNQLQVKDMMQRVDDLMNKYSCIRYLDLSSDERFVDTDFYDSDHLNRIGADKMTQIVATYLHGC